MSVLQNGTLTKVGSSQVDDLVKKGDTSVCIRLTKPLSISGDVLVEFFNKPKMMKKVIDLLSGNWSIVCSGVFRSCAF